MRVATCGDRSSIGRALACEARGCGIVARRSHSVLSSIFMCYNPGMPSKDPIKRQQAWNRWYAANKDKHHASVRKTAKKTRANLRAWLDDFKANLSCSGCGFSHPAVIDFHHRDPSQKDFSIGDASTRGVSLRRLKLEIEKCVVLCKNCHAIRHWNETLGVEGKQQSRQPVTLEIAGSAPVDPVAT